MEEWKGKNLFFIDAETDGLYGPLISVGVVVTDHLCREIERAYYGIDKEKLEVHDPWVKENVLPILGDYVNVSDEKELLAKVWELWDKYRENAYAVADVGYPVEMGLFSKAVKADPDDRKFKGPFPLLDISSILLTKGIDPLTDRKSLIKITSEDKQHNALFDVEMSIELWKKYILGE